MATKEISAVVEEPGRMALREFDIPPIGPDEALLRVEMAGVCGSDPKFYHGTAGQHCRYPAILGHETLGRIAQIGEVASLRYGLRVGDRVIVESAVPCGHCRYCLIGSYRLCDNRQGYGGKVPASQPPHLWGSYGQYMYVAPGSMLHPISPHVPAEAAVLAGLIANGVQWVRIIGNASMTQSVVIQGAGPQGLSMTVAAKESGASPIVITGLSVDRERLELARDLGADYCIDVQEEDPVERVWQITGGLLSDLVVDVTGSPEAMQKSLKMVRKQGTVVLAGMVGSGKLTPLPTDDILSKEVRIQGVLGKGVDAVNAAVKLIESRRYPLEKMVTHKYSLEAAEEAVRAMGREIRDVFPIKAVIVPWQSS